jgi:hypothetical protein
MPPRFKRRRVVDEEGFSSPDDNRKGLRKAAQIVRLTEGDLKLRVCCYSTRRNANGTEWEGISPWPPEVPLEEGHRMAEAIDKLLGRWESIKEAIMDRPDPRSPHHELPPKERPRNPK